MSIIRIDKSIADEIENMIERRDKMYEDQRAATRKLSDSVEKMYTQELKKLRNQLQQKENIIKDIREMAEEKSREEIFGWSWEILRIIRKGSDK